MNNRIGNKKRGHSTVTRLRIVFAAAIALLTTSALAQNETVLYSFAGTPDGQNPGYNLIRDAAGNLYGVTFGGGTFARGTVFELVSQGAGVWSQTTLHSFAGWPGDGDTPSGALVMDPGGNLYGATVSGGAHDLGAIYKLARNGQGNWAETLFFSFNGHGYFPRGGLILDAADSLYGGTGAGGGPLCKICGVVFKLSPPAKNRSKWRFFALHQFAGQKYGDGAVPNGDLIFDAAGNLYGNTQAGGTGNVGSVFELSPAGKTWTEKVLHSFQGPDGWQPNAGLILDAAGNLYGITSSGGNAGRGTVFELSPDGGGWTEAVLYSFTGLNDGGLPFSPVIFHNGALYGTASGGGNPSCPAGCGLVFALSPGGSGWTEQVVHTFTSSPDGGIPTGGVIFDSNGNLYGNASYGGISNSSCPSGCGVVYEISP